MELTLESIPRKLNKSNIGKAISDYIVMMSHIPVQIDAVNVLELLGKLKRGKIGKGPYPEVSIFEAANRIMTDLTILYGIKELLDGKLEGVDFNEYLVEFGNENKNDHDIMATKGDLELVGEAFNAAESFFHVKKSTSLKKLRGENNQTKILLLMYNSDAVKAGYRPKANDNEYHLAVRIQLPQ